MTRTRTHRRDASYTANVQGSFDKLYGQFLSKELAQQPIRGDQNQLDIKAKERLTDDRTPEQTPLDRRLGQDQVPQKPERAASNKAMQPTHRKQTAKVPRKGRIK